MQYQQTWGYGNQRGHFQQPPNEQQNLGHGPARNGSNDSGWNNGGFNEERNQQSWGRARGVTGGGRGANGGGRRGGRGRGPYHVGGTLLQHQQISDGGDIRVGKSWGESRSSSYQGTQRAYQTAPTGTFILFCQHNFFIYSFPV